MFATAMPGYDWGRALIMDVGDYPYNGPDGTYDVAMTLPVHSDLWYLTISQSILPYSAETYNIEERRARILEILNPMIQRLDNIAPLKSIQSYSDLQRVFSVYHMREFFDTSSAVQVIREARYEMWLFNRSTEFPSKGPKGCSEAGVHSSSDHSMGNLYGGFIAFPIGPLGVMEIVSMFSESMIEKLDNNLPFNQDGSVKIYPTADFKCTRLLYLDGFVSPKEDSNTATTPGVHLIEKGYLSVSRDAEYPGSKFEKYDYEPRLKDLRVYFHRTSKWPVPGEFVCILTKPWPDHIWWFQQTSPLLYSGNWVETTHYTSGIVKEVLDAPAGQYGKIYKCTIRGVDQYIAASDFCQYQVGDRVAILRLSDLDRFQLRKTDNFKWIEMEDLFAREKRERDTPSNESYIINTNYMIVPMSFYKP